jgi:hypothetical protein
MELPMKKVFLVSLLLLLALAISGCDRQKGAERSTVTVTPAFLEHFGQLPETETGSCIARVGYFPLKGDPARVRAVPYILFRESGQLEQILGRMVSEREIFLPGGDFFTPFPPGSSVWLSLDDEGIVLVDLTPGAEMTQEDLQGAVAAITETAVQFDKVDRVRILLAGDPVPGMPGEGFRHEPGRIAPVPPPTLLMVSGMWEEGDEEPDEILVNFDRPVTVEDFRLLGPSGEAVRGDYYRSVFDMAVVIHPENPGDFAEGMLLRAEWEVVDALGRRGKGSGEFALKRHDH